MNLRNKGGKADKAAPQVTPASSRGCTTRRTAVAANPGLFSYHSSKEDLHSSVDDVSGPEKTPLTSKNCAVPMLLY